MYIVYSTVTFNSTGEVLGLVVGGADCASALLLREERVDIVGRLVVGREGRRRAGEPLPVLLDALPHVRAELLLETHTHAHSERVARNA